MTEERIIRLEERMNVHAKEIEELRRNGQMMSEKLDSIVRSLNAIRNWVVGAIAFAAMEQMGGLEILKKILF